jgi:PAS domain S-box-containing protein
LISSSTKARARTFCLALLFLILGSSGSSLAQSDLASKKVLILHSYAANSPVSLETDKGLSDTLHSGGIPNLNQFFVSLDLARNPASKYRKLLVEQVRTQYSHSKPDMIITMLPEALAFVLQDCKDIFPDVPILALYDYPNSAAPKTDRRIIKHFVKFDIIGTLDIALKLVPGTKKVYVVSGAHEVDKSIEDQARLIFKKWEGQIEFLYLSHMPFDDILAAVSNARPHSIVLFLSFFQDVSGRIYFTPDIVEQLSRVSTAPLFGVFEAGLGHGMVGGSLSSYELIGNKAGQLTLDVLGSPDSPDIPAVLDVSPVPMFDWRQLRHWNVSETALPKGSVVINKELTLWDLKYYIIGGLAFVLLETILIIFLIVQRRRKKTAEEELNQFFNVSLDLKCIANTDAYFLRLNPAWERTLGYTLEELMAKQFLDFVHPDDLDKTREVVSTLASQEKVVFFENRYRCKDGTYRWLQWSSVPVGNLIYAAARDVTGQKQAEQALEERLKFEQLLTDFSARFVNIPPARVDSQIEVGLRQILEFFQVDRCALLRTFPDKISWQITHLVSSDDVPPAPKGVKLSRSMYPWVYEKLAEKHQVLSISRLDDLPAEANVDKQACIDWGIRSFLDIPILIGESVDIIHIGSVKTERAWSEDLFPRLRLLGEIVVNALERGNAEQALRKAEEKYRGIFEGALEGIFETSPDGKLLTANIALARIMGYDSPEEMTSTIWNTAIQAWVDPQERAEYVRLLETQGFVRNFECRLRRKDGTPILLSMNTRQVRGPDGKTLYYSGILEDITERKRAEEASRESERMLKQNESDLRKLAGRLIYAQEEERSRLARELHDDLAQRLAVSAIAVGQLEQQLMNSPAPVREELREIQGGIVRISQDVHSLSRQLHPSILDDLGLIKAAESECVSFSRREGIDVVFNHENVPRVIPKDVSLALYRMIQEGLRNISKHACAEHISVSLNGIDHDVFLSVQDDGIGFDWEDVKENPGLGFSSMRERARLIHGELSIQSQPGKGTMITLRVPLTGEGV